MREFGRFRQNVRVKRHHTDTIRSFPWVKWSKRESTHRPPCRLQLNVNKSRPHSGRILIEEIARYLKGSDEHDEKPKDRHQVTIEPGAFRIQIHRFTATTHWNLSLIQSFRPYYGPGVDSASNRNEYQEYFLGGKGGRCVGMTTLPPSCADCLEIWDPQPSGSLRPVQSCNGIELPLPPQQRTAPIFCTYCVLDACVLGLLRTH